MFCLVVSFAFNLLFCDGFQSDFRSTWNNLYLYKRPNHWWIRFLFPFSISATTTKNRKGGTWLWVKCWKYFFLLNWKSPLCKCEGMSRWRGKNTEEMRNIDVKIQYVRVCFGAFCGYSCLSKCIANISNLSMVRQNFTTRLGKSSIEKLMLNVYKHKAFYFLFSLSTTPVWYAMELVFDGVRYVLFAPFFFLFRSLVIRISISFDVLLAFTYVSTQTLTAFIRMNIVLMCGSSIVGTA